MPRTAFDPAALRLWRLAERLASGIQAVHVLRAREAPMRGLGRGAHQHVVPTVVACLEGVCRMSSAAGDLDLGPGEMVVVAPAAWHEQQELRRGSSIFGQGLVFGRSDVVLTDDGHAFTAFLPAEPATRILHAMLTAEPGPRRTLAMELLAEFIRTPAEGWESVHPALMRMSERLWTTVHRGPSAAEILSASGLSPRQAHRLFTRWHGAPPQEVIRSQQLALARELLREGASVTEAAAASGFPDRRALTRAWRKAFGGPPTRT